MKQFSLTLNGESNSYSAEFDPYLVKLLKFFSYFVPHGSEGTMLNAECFMLTGPFSAAGAPCSPYLPLSVPCPVVYDSYPSVWTLRPNRCTCHAPCSPSTTSFNVIKYLKSRTPFLTLYNNPQSFLRIQFRHPFTPLTAKALD